MNIFGVSDQRARGSDLAQFRFALPVYSFEVFSLTEECAWGGDTDGSGAVDDQDDLLIVQREAGLLDLTDSEDCRGDWDLSGLAELPDVIQRYGLSAASPAAVDVTVGSGEGNPGDLVEIGIGFNAAGVAGGVVKVVSNPVLSPPEWQPGTGCDGFTECFGLGFMP